ncbi:4'-phosphopantetheinyl transferase superfamily protein [Streptomyces sp. P17]|uniref:4'-phosphopantetheinyl transferase family protein n=1 Tax=Streptomyces sp. P17 TaxID=3074716 RepID=UPI0028F424F4|nr:4'-phosphopantetheinyl transferase superfamily protein [Streptomyces sp. P17]MDT9694670.1 4'-phosphopantetheinyl transferase superfamily protein [Streptomyces sp. P17]
MAAPTAGAPVLVSGPEGQWDEVLRPLATRGTVVTYGRVADWLPGETEERVLRPLLGPRDWARFHRLSHRRVREGFLASRLLLKHTAARVLASRPEAVDLAYKPGGRPYLRGCDQIDISLSHTEEVMVVGVTRRGLLGVDVERAERPMVGTGVEFQACTPHERALLDSLPEQTRNKALVRLWTLKEAYSKAIGQGLRFRFTEFGFTLDDARIRLQRPDGSPGTGPEWSFGTYALESDYVVSAALRDEGFGAAADTAADTTLDQSLLGVLLGRL